MIVTGCVAAAAYLVLRAPHHIVVSPTLVTFAINPLLGLAVGAALVGAIRIRAITHKRSTRSDRRADEILAADLVASGVEAGVSFDEAVSVAAGFVHASVASEMRRMARVAHHASTTDGDESIVDEMFRLSRRSAASGAPLAPGLRSLSESERAKDAAERLERLERLPVKLLFPLAFLILPGFLLVAVAPALVSGISKLSL
jgi:pilus assembly protein TadC